MRVLLIDEAARTRIKQVMEHADRNRIDTDALLDIKNGMKPPPGDDPNFVCHLAHNFRVVFTVDEIKERDYLMRHISISLTDSDKLPNVAAVEMIIKEFGFKEELHNCHISLEEDHAINVIGDY